MTKVLYIDENGLSEILDIDTSPDNSQVSYVMGGRVTFLGKVDADHVIIVRRYQRDIPDYNPYDFGVTVDAFRGPALVVKTNGDGDPIDYLVG